MTVNPKYCAPVPITKRNLGGRMVNPIGLGAMNICHAYRSPPPADYARRLLVEALDLGYDHIDTARLYGMGMSETLIGEAIGHRRADYYLASKTGIFVEDGRRFVSCTPERIRGALEESLRLLQTDFIDLYYLHRPDKTVPIEESVGELKRMVEAGKIGGYGLSEMDAETIARAHAVHPCVAVQTEYSPMTRNPEIAVLDTCAELGITFVAFSPVGRGALADLELDPDALEPTDLRRLLPRFHAEHWEANRALYAEYGQIAADIGMTAAQLSLAWTNARAEHIVSIPGTASIEHLAENIAKWDVSLDAETMARVDALINERTISGGRYNAALQEGVTTEEFA